VSFVVGSFVLADSLRATFDNLFTELNENVDLEVRSAQEFDSDNAREPIDVAIADDIRNIDGVEIVEPVLQRFAQLIDADGDVITPAGGPTLGVSWEGDERHPGRHHQGGQATVGSRRTRHRQGNRRRTELRGRRHRVVPHRCRQVRGDDHGHRRPRQR
jgi:putative ABC transport system permease protein